MLTHLAGETIGNLGNVCENFLDMGMSRHPCEFAPVIRGDGKVSLNDNELSIRDAGIKKLALDDRHLFRERIGECV